MKHAKLFGSKKTILVTVFVVVAVAAIALFGVSTLSKHSNESQNGMAGKYGYTSPTDEEKKFSDSIKDKIVANQQKDEPTGVTPVKSVRVIIVDAAQYENVIEVRSFTEGLHSKGSCTTRFTKGSLVIEKTSPAYPDASSTICNNPNVQRSEFSEPGEWQVVVKFSASGSYGISNPQTITLK